MIAMHSWFEFIPLGWATLAIAIGLITFTRAYLGLGPVAQLRARTQLRLPEAGRYDARRLTAYVHAAGGHYRRQLRWDLLFIAVYVPGLFAVLDGTLGASLRNPARWVVLAWMPVALGLVDVLEDLALLRTTKAADEPGWAPRGIVFGVARTSTVLKLLLEIAVGALIVAGCVALGIGGANSW